MSNLTIKDLPRNEEMDSNDMAAIDGGFSFPNNVAPIKLIAPPKPVNTPNLPPTGDAGGFPSGDSGGGGGYLGDGSDYLPY